MTTSEQECWLAECHSPVAELLKRFDVTGARWSLDAAEAMLKLRAVRATGDWAQYWHHHLAAERERVHASRYASGVISVAA